MSRKRYSRAHLQAAQSNAWRQAQAFCTLTEESINRDDLDMLRDRYLHHGHLSYDLLHTEMSEERIERLKFLLIPCHQESDRER